MANILNNIYMISAMTAGVILILLIIRKLAGKKAGAWWRTIIWFIILFRMLIPFTISSPFSIYNTQSIKDFTQNVAQVIQPDINESLNEQPLYEDNEAVNTTSSDAIAIDENDTENATATDSSTINQPTYNNTRPANTKTNWLQISYYIYLSGLLASLTYLIIRMISLSIGLKHFEECTDNRIIDLFDAIKFRMNVTRKIKILIDRNISVPAITGVFKPKLILPQKAISTMTDAQLEYIFIHELTHLKRNDVLKLWFLEFVICIHWFNPVLYFVKSIIRQDIELSCDEKIISSLDDKHYIDYCNVLMLTSIKKYKPIPGIITANMAGKSGSKLKERLTMINKFNKKKTLIYGMVILMVIVTVFISCTTQSIAKEDENIVPIDWDAEPKTVDILFNGEKYYSSVGIINTSDMDTMIDAVNEKLLEELNFKVNFQWLGYHNYTDELALLLASDDSPDMAAQYSLPDYYKPLADKNLLVDITDMKYQYMPKLTKRLEKLTPNYFDNQNLQGDLYTMPSVGHYYIRNVVAVLKEVQDNYGKKINNADDYFKFMEWCKEEYPDMSPGYILPNVFIDTYMLSNNCLSSGTTVYTKNDDTRYPMEMLDEFMECYELLQQWKSIYSKGRWSTASFDHGMRARKVASVLGDYYNLNSMLFDFPKDVEVYYHVLNTDKEVLAIPNGYGFVFCKNGDAVEDGMRFLEWVHESQENYDLIKYGIEDTQYNLENSKLYFPKTLSNTIYTWSGNHFFDDNNLERQLINESNKKEDLINSMALVNSKYIYEDLEDDKTKREYSDEELAQVYELQDKISTIFDQRFKVYNKLIGKWQKNDYSMTSEEVIQLLLTEGKGDELFEALSELNELYKLMER